MLPHTLVRVVSSLTFVIGLVAYDAFLPLRRAACLLTVLFVRLAHQAVEVTWSIRLIFVSTLRS